ncbi:hypothetical protein [Uliginosibacterium aquaticum]|uniref:Phosphoglycerate mutase n=1 Tax=Uliginosibacterium aquaticum TaxID=2731212 RepID=A0ABX2IDL4_9RHOO|nr:hypothetical protein [Uliginosibacterium aquaticum]NSL54591.1 hypothetical protein [Uliginosibacterium aquaticum]
MSFHPSMGTRPKHSEPIRVTLVLPGLVWPGSGITASLQQLDLPALATLLGRGDTREQAAEPWSQWLPAQFGASELPWAALRLAGEDTQPTTAATHVLCADPVSLSFASDALLLRGPRELALPPDEVSALITALNTEFGDMGQWLATSPERFYLLAKEPIHARFHPLAEVLGRPVAFFPPEGEDARRWNRLANEIQVTLHNHPVSQARSERGQLAPNALWFWGETPLAPEGRGAGGEGLQAPTTHLCSPDPLLRGLARRAGCQLIDSPARLIAGLPGHSWLHDGRLQEAAQMGDFNAWLGGLQALDKELLQPLLAAWQAGRVHNITLHAPSDKRLLSARLPRHARWAFWRKPLSTAAVARQLQAPTENRPA